MIERIQETIKSEVTRKEGQDKELMQALQKK